MPTDVTRDRCPRRLRDERGQVLVLAMAIIFIGTLLALGAVGFALNIGGSEAHDQQRREGQQAADAGVQQQLFQQANVNAIGFGASSGSLGSLVACAESNLGTSAAANAQTTIVRAALGVGGACPRQPCVQGTPNCASPGGPQWTGLDNFDNYLAEFCPNPVPQSAGASPGTACGSQPAPTVGSSLIVEFPEVISVGCHSATSTCDQNTSANQYAKELALVHPTAPLQAIEGENNVSINNSNYEYCGVLSTVCVTAAVSPLNSTILDGNIIAGNALQVPDTTLGLSSTTAGNLVNNVVNNLLGLGSLLPGASTLTSNLRQDLGLQTGQQPVSLTPTLEYGNCYGTTVSPGYGASSPAGSYSCSGTPTAPNGNFVKTGLSNPCQAGQLSASCSLVRPPFKIGSPATVTPAATISADLSGATLACTSTLSANLNSGNAGNCYSNGDLSLTSGTLTLAPGTYVFCNVYIGSGATIQGPSGSGSGAVQIYILSPGSSQCSANASGANEVAGAACTGADTEGNFTAAGGISDQLGGTVNGLTSTVDPSNFQIYVAGDTADALTVNSNCQPRTTTTIGGTSANGLYTQAIQAFVLYAPRSDASVTTSLNFEGSAVAWNVNLTALAIAQDLDLGNYPLSSVVDSYQVAQTQSCAPTVTELTGASGDLGGC